MRVERQVLFWLAALILLILAALVLRSVLLPFVAGMVIAYALNPLADRLGALGLPRVWASAIVVVLLNMVLVAAVVFLVPIIARQVQQLVEVLPGEIERVRGMVEDSARERLGSRFGDRTFECVGRAAIGVERLGVLHHVQNVGVFRT